MISDLGLGIRLAFGGSRMSGTSLLRLLMTALGIGLAVAVLLPAASIPNVLGGHSERVSAQSMVEQPRPGVDPLYTIESPRIEAGGEYFRVTYLAASGPDSPVPPGVSRIPAPGDVVVSPEVAHLLEGTHADAVRARLPGTVVGRIDDAGLAAADQLRVYAGAPLEKVRSAETARTVYGFGAGGAPAAVAFEKTLATAVALPAAVVLLLPLLTFVTAASRMGAAQRERRLAALRLVGLDSRRVRRVAAAESLVGAVVGLVAGVGLFLVLRPVLGRIEYGGTRYFTEDIVPPWPLAVLIAVLVPALAVGAAMFGLRRIVVEPLGVVRQGKPLRRRLWWRVAAVVVGVGITIGAMLLGSGGDQTMVPLSAGLGLVLVGVSVLVPWLVEKLVSRIRGGPPSWQLAIRRLQLDSGTPSRVVSILVVMLAGAILMQGVLSASGAGADADSVRPEGQLPVRVQADSENLERVRELIATVPQVEESRVLRSVSLTAEHGGTRRATVGTCAALSVVADLPSCSDGAVFAVEGPGVPGYSVVPRETVRFEGPSGEPGAGPRWTMPDEAEVPVLPPDSVNSLAASNLLITESALEGIPVPTSGRVSVHVGGTARDREMVTAVAAAVRPLAWEAEVGLAYFDDANHTGKTESQKKTVQDALLVASLLVLMVAALSLLICSIEQTIERRRPLAALAATGVAPSVLLRGSLWQTGVPMLIGVVVAIPAGIGLTFPVVRIAKVPLSIDAGTVTLLAVGALASVLVCTALTWPLLRQATRLESLRAE